MRRRRRCAQASKVRPELCGSGPILRARRSEGRTPAPGHGDARRRIQDDSLFRIIDPNFLLHLQTPSSNLEHRSIFMYEDVSKPAFENKLVRAFGFLLEEFALDSSAPLDGF